MYSVFGVGPALGQRAMSWMMVVEGDFATWPASSVDAVNELSAITQLERARRDDAPLAMLVASFGPAQWGEDALAIVNDVASHLGPSVVAAGHEGLTVAIVQASDALFCDRLRSASMRLTSSMSRSPLSVGISDAAPLSALSGMWEEARHARNLAARRGDPVCVVSGSEVTSHVLLMATVPDDVRRTFAHRVLGPVWDYDEKHQAGLHETLAAFLSCSGSWSRTAEQMHLHVNTVRYRIQRVEELTGRDLSILEDRVDVFLALHSLP